jgi:hypothetical protein
MNSREASNRDNNNSRNNSKNRNASNNRNVDDSRDSSDSRDYRKLHQQWTGRLPYIGKPATAKVPATAGTK